MRILYIGDANVGTTSLHRAQALQRLGHSVDVIDPYQALGASWRGWRGALHYRTGYVFLRRRVIAWLCLTLAGRATYDVAWVDCGELPNAEAIKRLKQFSHKVVLFNHDDPTGPRDYRRFTTLRQAVSQYDLCVVVRPINVAEFKALGARCVMHTWRRYDEVEHREPAGVQPVPLGFQSDVAFIGYRIKREGRDQFILQLANMGLTPAIWGDNWQTSKHWPELKRYWRGHSLSGRDYVDAIRGAKVCLGLLSKGNRDEHTTRTLEIPYAGGLLCAERTPEHLSLFVEGKEAVFWNTAQECAALCRRLIDHPDEREAIRRAGQRKVIDAHLGNEDLCRAVLDQLTTANPQAADRCNVDESLK